MRSELKSLAIVIRIMQCPIPTLAAASNESEISASLISVARSCSHLFVRTLVGSRGTSNPFLSVDCLFLEFLVIQSYDLGLPGISPFKESIALVAL